MAGGLWNIWNAILYRIFYWKPWNPMKRLESFDRQLALLKFLGLWPPQKGSHRARIAYKIYGWCFRITFMYIYTLTQALYFLKVQDLQGVADALFLLMTQISLLIKLEIFNSNIDRIQKLLRQVECATYDPRNEEENKEVIKSMNTTWLIGTMFMAACYGTVTFWTASVLFKQDRNLPLPAWYPFDYQQSLPLFCFVWLYQVFGIYMSATYNVATDTMATGLISHVSGQAGRLGIMISKTGHEGQRSLSVTGEKIKHELDLDCHVCDQLSHLHENKDRYDYLYGSSYSYLVALILFHKGLFKFEREVIKIFNVSIFTQVIASVIIICMTGLRVLSGKNHLMTTIGDIVYLMAMICQIFQFCYVGNEVFYKNYQFNEMSVFSNCTRFNIPLKKVFLIYLVRIMQPNEMKVGVVFDFILSLSTFLWILKTSYSYFAVLNTVK